MAGRFQQNLEKSANKKMNTLQCLSNVKFVQITFANCQALENYYHKTVVADAKLVFALTDLRQVWYLVYDEKSIEELSETYCPQLTMPPVDLMNLLQGYLNKTQSKLNSQITFTKVRFSHAVNCISVTNFFVLT